MQFQRLQASAVIREIFRLKASRFEFCAGQGGTGYVWFISDYHNFPSPVLFHSMFHSLFYHPGLVQWTHLQYKYQGMLSHPPCNNNKNILS
jgi:hypothetical protein